MHDDLVVVHHLDAIDGTYAILIAYGRGVLAAWVLVVTPQSVIVHHVLGGKFAVAMVELHALAQLEAPGASILGHFRTLGQPGIILARRRVNLKQPLVHRVMLDNVVRRAIDPRAPVIPIGQDQAHHQTIHLGLPRCWLALGLATWQEQDQQHRYHEKQRLKLPESRLPHKCTSVVPRITYRLYPAYTP